MSSYGNQEVRVGVREDLKGVGPPYSPLPKERAPSFMKYYQLEPNGTVSSLSMAWVSTLFVEYMMLIYYLYILYCISVLLYIMYRLIMDFRLKSTH